MEFLVPSFLMVYFVFAQCGVYIKAGRTLINVNSKFADVTKTSKQTIKNTEWFYSDNNNSSNKEEKRKRLIDNLEKEKIEWKQLLDAGEVDEATFNQEINRINEKIKRI